MTSDSRVDVLQSLLERVQRNAREPRPASLAGSEHVSQTRREQEQNHVELPPESIAFDLVPAPKSPTTTPYDGRRFEAARSNAAPPSNHFNDEPTASGNAPEIENLLLQEQAAAERTKIQFEEHRAPTTRPPPEPPLETRPPDDDDGPDLLVLDEFEVADAAITEPPPASRDASPPPSIPSSALPDLDAIEADLLESRAPSKTIPEPDEPEPDSSRTRLHAFRQHDFVEEATGERLKSTPPPEDEAPSSVRKPRESERAEDTRFDGFGPIETPSEPPPESGEVPSQRRVATPHEIEREAEAEAEEPSGDVALVEPGFDHEETKEVRALGRVDVVERTRIEQPMDIAVQKGEPRATETFAAILDAALSLSPTPSG